MSFMGTEIFFLPFFKLLKFSNFVVEFCDAFTIVYWFDVAVLVKSAFHDEEELATGAILDVLHH
jgi:hypothetical protein